MFGMLRVPKGYLEEKEQEIFQAHYCGLCNALGRCGFTGLRMATSYDGAALALFYSALSGEESVFRYKSCPFTPWRKKAMLLMPEGAVEFAATASLGIIKLKAQDEISDGTVLAKSLLLKGLLRYLSAKVPAWSEFTAVQELQQSAERAEQAWFDELAYPSGLLLGSLAARAARENTRDENLAFHLGENLGKWIYTWDALWDFADDQRQGRFNAIASAYGLKTMEPREWSPDILEEMDFVLERCLGEILEHLHLLDLGTQGKILAKLISGAHSWHKRSFVEEFYQGGEDYERLPRTWRTIVCNPEVTNPSSGVGE